jgi:hypothetical protein
MVITPHPPKKSHQSNQPNMNSTIKVAARVAENETNQMGTVTQKRKAFNI